MELKLEIDETRFKEVLDKELNAFTQEELHEICTKALIQQLSDPNVFKSLFICKDNSYYNSNVEKANEVLKDAARNISFDETFKKLQDGIVKYINENYKDILHEIVIDMFVNGLGNNIFYSSNFKDKLRSELYLVQPH